MQQEQSENKLKNMKRQRLAEMEADGYSKGVSQEKVNQRTIRYLNKFIAVFESAKNLDHAIQRLGHAKINGQPVGLPRLREDKILNEYGHCPADFSGFDGRVGGFCSEAEISCDQGISLMLASANHMASLATEGGFLQEDIVDEQGVYCSKKAVFDATEIIEKSSKGIGPILEKEDPKTKQFKLNKKFIDNINKEIERLERGIYGNKAVDTIKMLENVEAAKSPGKFLHKATLFGSGAFFATGLVQVREGDLDSINAIRDFLNSPSDLGLGKLDDVSVLGLMGIVAGASIAAYALFALYDHCKNAQEQTKGNSQPAEFQGPPVVSQI